MIYVKRQPLWQRRWTLGPGAATLLGVALGGALAIVSALTPPRDFSFRVFLVLLSSLGVFGGIFGYILWLSSDSKQGERLLRITSLVACAAIVGLLVAFPNFWRHIARSSGPLVVVVLMGGVCASAMFAVGACWGMVHLVDHLLSSPRKPAKPGAGSRDDGVWDRELDRG
jgi:hypothetical protein